MTFTEVLTTFSPVVPAVVLITFVLFGIMFGAIKLFVLGEQYVKPGYMWLYNTFGILVAFVALCFMFFGIIWLCFI